MKLYRNALILLIILGVLAGGYFFLNSRKAGTSEASDSTASKEIKVVTVDKDKINLIEINNEEGSFKLAKKDKTWSMEPAAELPMNSDAAETYASDLTQIAAVRVVEDNASDLSKYGLDKPATIKISLSDGSSKEILVGSYNPTNEGIYVKNSDGNKVYLVNKDSEDNLKAGRSRFIKKDILPVEYTDLKTFSFERNGELQFAIDIPSSSEIKVVKPVEENGESSKVGPMLSSVVGLRIGDIVDENPSDLSKYGLDKPAYAIEYGDAKTTKKILIGNEVEKGSTAYAKFPDGKTVYTIDTSSLTFLDAKLSDVITPFVYLPNISDVNKVELFIDGQKIVSDITTDKDNSDNDKFMVNGKDANMKDEKDSSLFKKFYQALIGVTMYKYEPEGKPAGTPEVTIKYYMKPDSKAVTVDFISKDDNYYYAVKDGVYTNKVVLKSRFDEPEGIRETYKALLKAIGETK